MYVMTVDQRHSRRDVDRVDGLIADLRPHQLVRQFERTAGDEIQGVADDPTVVVDVALDLVRNGHWSVGIGIGPVDEPLPETTRAGRGPAFEAARTAVTRAKNTPAGIAVDGTDEQAAADAEAIITLLAMLVARRSPEGHAAVEQLRQGLSQSEAADKLGISKQAVSQRLSAAGWQAEGPARALAARLLGEADKE